MKNLYKMKCIIGGPYFLFIQYVKSFQYQMRSSNLDFEYNHCIQQLEYFITFIVHCVRESPRTY